MRLPICCLFALLAAGQTLKVGAPAPALTLERTIPTGANTSWEALRGKAVVIEFWATWCGNCVAEIPNLNELQAKFPDIQFISITDEPLSVVEPFLVKRPIQGVVGLDSNGATFKSYGVEARPQTMLVDKDGVLRGIMHPAQVSEAVLSDLAAGRPVSPSSLKSRLRILDEKTSDPVFAVILRPSARAKAGGRFNIDPGALEAENITLKTILAFAYSVNQNRLEGPEDLLALRFDLCVLLPEGVTGDEEILRDALERTLRLKLRREAREMDVLALKVSGAKPKESPGPTVSLLTSSLEWRLKRPIVNETGLTGRYRFEFPDNSDDIPKALREQLGLELSPARRPVEFLIVDSMALPTYRVGLPGR